MKTKLRLSDVFDAVDAMDIDAFVSFLADDAVFRYGSEPPIRGRAAIRDDVAALFRSLRGIRHRVIQTWEREDSFVCQGEVTYIRRDGAEITLPFVNVFRLDYGRIRDYLVYVDPRPLASRPR